MPLPSHSLHSIPAGDAGIRATLKMMREIVVRWKTQPRIRQLAIEITRSCNGDSACEIAKLHAWVRDRIAYKRDIVNVETLSTPDLTLENGTGDCDDQSILLAALYESIGYPTRFVAIDAGRQNGYSHVYTEVQTTSGKWIAAETTLPWPLGAKPDTVRRRLVQR